MHPAAFGNLVTECIREVGSDAKIPFYHVCKGSVRRSAFHKEVLEQEILVINFWESLSLHVYLLHLVCM